MADLRFLLAVLVEMTEKTGQCSVSNAVAALPGGGLHNRKEERTVRAQRVFAPPVAEFVDRGRQGGVAALFLVLFLGKQKKDAPPAGNRG